MFPILISSLVRQYILARVGSVVLFYWVEVTAPRVTVGGAAVTGSAAAANNDRGSVPSNTLLRGSIMELEEEEEVEEVLPFRLIFLVLDSVT